MSIRKRTWKTAKGEAKEAWVVDYVDGAGKRRLKTFSKKKEADAYETTAKHELAQGTHTPDSASVTVAEAAERWLKTCESRDYPVERSTLAFYEQTVRLHIVPAIGGTKLSKLTTSRVRDFEDDLRKGGVSPAMIRKIRVNLGAVLSDAQERGLVARNVVKELRARRTPGTVSYTHLICMSGDRHLVLLPLLRRSVTRLACMAWPHVQATGMRRGSLWMPLPAMASTTNTETQHKRPGI